jgi:hypothetical protein
LRTAAQLLHGRRDGDWIDELEQLAEQIEGVSPNAKATLRVTVESLLSDPTETDARKALRLLGGFD